MTEDYKVLSIQDLKERIKEETDPGRRQILEAVKFSLTYGREGNLKDMLRNNPPLSVESAERLIYEFKKKFSSFPKGRKP